MITPPSHVRASELIGRIYDCVLDPQAWEAVLEDIRAEFGFANAVLGVNALHGGTGIYANARFPVEDTGAFAAQYGAEIIAIWGGDRIRNYPLGEPLVLSRIQTREVLRATRYYREWCGPRGLADALTIRVTDDPVSIGNVTLGQAEALGDVRDDQVDGMRLLAPHLRRAVTISNVLDNRAIEAATFARTIDALQAAVVLVDETCGIVYANPSAQAMLAKGDPILERRGSLTVAADMARDALHAAVKQSANDEAKLGERGIGIPVQSSTGEAALVHVLPLQRGHLRPGVAQRAVAALFILPSSVPARLPHDALVLLYDMTPAEVRVCEMISEGTSPSEIATVLGVSINTVRSHLARVLDKTGSKRQADLVRLVASLALRV